MLTDKLPNPFKKVAKLVNGKLKWKEDQDAGGNSLNKLLRAQLEEISTPSTPPSGYKELFTKSSGLAHILDDTGVETPLLGQLGSSSWKNRTYEGYEVLDTATTYTIGSTGDYTSLYNAIEDLQGLILTESLTLQLQENITSTSQIQPRGLITAGGRLVIDLQSNVWTLDTGDSFPFLVPSSPLHIQVRGDGSASATLKYGTSQGGFLGINCRAHTFLEYFFITLDGNSQDTNFFTETRRGDLYIGSDVSFSNVASMSTAAISATNGGKVAGRSSIPSVAVDNGAILIKSDGTVVT